MDNSYRKQKIDCIINVSEIVTIHYFEFDRNFRSHGEKHDFWEMVYVDKGEAIIKAKNNELTLRQGEAVFHKPNEFHAVSANGKVAPNVFIITFVCRSKAMDFFKGKQLSIPMPMRACIAGIISEAEASYHLARNNPYLTELRLKDNAPKGGEQLIKINLEMLLIQLLRFDINAKKATTVSREIHDNLIAGVVELIHSGIYGKITVDDICRKLSFSRSYISAKFKDCCNMTMNEYINKAKIEEAKTLIREEKHSISEISEMLCYDNPHYFSKVFKRVTNMSPTEYRESVKI
ncbi:MAG: helix-turn-helix domain-containing protein [Ruminococcaceae bacterium]|nr:helix-turn-helix domain-containing protein [Oscillospiraceae bacterium]